MMGISIQGIINREAESIEAIWRLYSDQNKIMSLIEKRAVAYSDLYNIANGIAGVSLLMNHLYEVTGQSRFKDMAVTYLRNVIGYINESAEHQKGLMTGISGVNLALFTVAGNNTNLSHIYESINTLMEREVGKIIGKPPSKISIHHYDHIFGMSGILLSLIEGPQTSNIKDLAISIVDELCSRTSLLTALPEGFITDLSIYGDRFQDIRNEKVIDISLSHGISGVVYALSCALLNNLLDSRRKSEAKQCLYRLCMFILSSTRMDEKGNIQSLYKLPIEISGKSSYSSTSPSWCYGIPGISRAVNAAGEALDIRFLCKLADDMLCRSVTRSDTSLWDRELSSPILCHGHAGTIAILLRTNLSEKNLPEHIRKIEGFFDPELDCWFYEVAAGKKTEIGIGYLEGLTGILCSLLSVNSRRYNWDKPLMISSMQENLLPSQQI